jgi:hypothetical protein
VKIFYSKILVLFGLIIITQLISCSTIPQLPTNNIVLFTQESGHQYYYCESCNIPTELSIQVYKPLEPDSVPTIMKPVVKESIELNYKRRSKNKKKYKTNKIIKYYKKSKIKQCIEWR